MRDIDVWHFVTPEEVARALPEQPAPRALTPLQKDLLCAFFERERGFFLSGGAALAGYYLHHRQTSDLDLFTTRRRVR